MDRKIVSFYKKDYSETFSGNNGFEEKIHILSCNIEVLGNTALSSKYITRLNQQKNLRHGLVNSLNAISNGKFVYNLQCWFIKVDFPGIILSKRIIVIQGK